VQLGRNQERTLQAERAAARREMARRLTREMKESLFPLQMATEDLLCAREETSERFDEIFFECTATFRAELERLKNVASRFGEFARMPAPRIAPVSVNETVRAAMQGISSRWHSPERPPVTPETYLHESDCVIMADPDLLRIALENILLHCIEAMPSGGALVIRSNEDKGTACVEISAASAKLEGDEAARFFVPQSSILSSGNGLGLATAQAIVSDHGGRLSGVAQSNGGVSLRIEFSAGPAGVNPVAASRKAKPRRLTAGTSLASAMRLAEGERQPETNGTQKAGESVFAPTTAGRTL
jgi:two-component system nitrogen regulation sensor histidine kinase NtrY